ncbi:MAG: c-type cytochrome [Acidimicrobiia bacterium]|nr:c-type cytochrome [Acidimicrobiia bacterium]
MTQTRGNRAALVSIVLILVGIPTSILGYQYWLRPALAEHRVIDIATRVPENGGFSPDLVRAEVGETITLRFAVDDVAHGIAIGPGLDIDLGQIDPGHVGEITLTLDTPGIYTYYCNTWCSPSHWRMRGILEVVDPNASGSADAPSDPIIEALIAASVDIDAEPQLSEGILPDRSHGEQSFETVEVPPNLLDPTWRLSHTPAEGLVALRAKNPGSGDDVLTDVTAYLWSEPTPTIEIKELFAKNCAACHGERGAGDGPAATSTIETPVAFADVAWFRRGDIWYAKIRRGGMGTDMPNFGTLFTVEEARLLVDYLWYLSFK